MASIHFPFASLDPFQVKGMGSPIINITNTTEPPKRIFLLGRPTPTRNMGGAGWWREKEPATQTAAAAAAATATT